MIKRIFEAIKEGTFKKRAKAWIFKQKNKKNFNNDKKYLSERFNFIFGHYPDMNNPKSFSEKIMWLKLYWRDERCYDLVDKYEVRNYVKSLGLEEYLIPLIGVYNSWNEIDFDTLPNEFVIKTTHGGGGTGVFIVTNKFDKKQLKSAKKKINRSLKSPKEQIYKEWVYDKPIRKIVVEKLMKDLSNESIPDYKILCFDGRAKCLYVDSERQTNLKTDFFDLNWNWIDVKQGNQNNKHRPIKPENFEEMIKIAELLSNDFPHVRVDLYNINGKIYFGELTFFNYSGELRFEPESFDLHLGEQIDLEKIKNGPNYVKL